MKKISLVLAVLLVAASLFAAGTVKVGGAFELFTGKTQDLRNGEQTLANTKLSYKGNGFGFDISGKYDVKGDFAAWADFSMVFCSDAKFKEQVTSTWNSIDELYKIYQDVAKEFDGKASKAVNSLSLAAGTAVKLTIQAPFDVYVGAGVFFERALAKVSMTLPTSSSAPGETGVSLKEINAGVTLYADAAFRISEKIGIGLSLMPRIGFFNSTTFTTSDKSVKTDYKSSGFAMSFSLPVVVGVSYSF